MAIKIEKKDGGYIASFTPPHGKRAWSSEKPVTAKVILMAGNDIDCHQIDVLDALFDADPDWDKIYKSEMEKQND